MLMAGLPCFSILSRDVLAQNPRRGKRRLVQRDFRLERLREFVRTPSHRIDAEIAQDLRESRIAREGRDRARQPIDHGLRSAGRHENAVLVASRQPWERRETPRCVSRLTLPAGETSRFGSARSRP